MNDDLFLNDNNVIDQETEDFFASDDVLETTEGDEFDTVDLDDGPEPSGSAVGGLDVSNIQGSWVGLAIESQLKALQIWYTREFDKSLSDQQVMSLRLALIGAALGNNEAVNRSVMGRLSAGISTGLGVSAVSTAIPTGVPSSTYASKSDKGSSSVINIFKIHTDWKLYLVYTGNSETHAENCYLHASKKRTVINSYMCTECKSWKDKDKNNNIRRVFRYLIQGRMGNAKDFMNKASVTKFVKVFKEFPEILQTFIWPTEWIYAGDLKVLGSDKIVLLNTSGAKMSHPETSEKAKAYVKILFPLRNFYIQRKIARRWPTIGVRAESNNTIARKYNEALRAVNNTLRSKGVATISGVADLGPEDQVTEDEDDLFAGGEEEDLDLFGTPIPTKTLSKEPVTASVKDIFEEEIEEPISAETTEDLFGEQDAGLFETDVSPKPSTSGVKSLEESEEDIFEEEPAEGIKEEEFDDFGFG